MGEGNATDACALYRVPNGWSKHCRLRLSSDLIVVCVGLAFFIRSSCNLYVASRPHARQHPFLLHTTSSFGLSVQTALPAGAIPADDI